ncbi:MAG TPA: exodeoxyribonuclease VII large subunit [Gemmatimonadaceae bacterium]|jgi:exodeoxyribonuclease VII large subunit
MRASQYDVFATVLGRAGIGFAPDKPASVSDVALETRALVESGLHPLWVRGEISDFKQHRNGHWYFCLRDASAQIKCVVWSRDQRGLPAPPDDGMQVVLYGQMTVYTQRGDLQLKVTRMQADGDGLWRKAMEQTLAKLRGEGLLEESRKRSIPRFPKCVAIVTSPDGAAIGDIVAVLRKRHSGVQLVICPAKVQGDGAPREIVMALRRVARWGKADLVIVGRGGGAKEDLWAFNDERVARAIVACPIPVISAVGHETDITVCDAVADLRAPTPSAAAMAACVAREEIEKAFVAARRDLAFAMATLVRDARTDLERTRKRLGQSTERVVVRNRSTIGTAAARLNALSPLATLARGYAVARAADGAALTSVRHFKPGFDFELLFHDGKVNAETRSVE